MNLAKTKTLEGALDAGYPIFVTYREDTKEIVEWWPFGEGLAKGSAEIRNNTHGPESHNYASWEKYVVIRDEYNRNMAYLEEIEKRW